jgi:transposase
MKTAYENLGNNSLIGLLIERDFAILTLQQELAQLKRMIFGAKSERFVPSVPEEQTSLGLDVEMMVAPPVVKQAISYTREKQNNNKVHTGRLPIPAHIERIIIEVAPDVDVTGLKSIGEEITEELEYKAGSFYVNQYKRKKYAKADGEGIIIGTLPTRPIEKGMAGAGLLANIIIEKYVDHLPLYRQIQRFKRAGMDCMSSN